MSFEYETKKYLEDFQNVVKNILRTGNRSLEIATRPQVHNFIQRIINYCKEDNNLIDIFHDTTYTKYDRPDWRVEDRKTFGVFFFGDHKSLSLSAPYVLAKNEIDQINRYLSYNQPVFVFDGLEFIFYESIDGLPERISIIKKPSSLEINWATETINTSFIDKFRYWLLNPGFRKWTESELIAQLALRARGLAAIIYELLLSPGAETSADEKLQENLFNLQKEMIEFHEFDLSDKAYCSDYISQVLTFSLFYAHIQNNDTETDPNHLFNLLRMYWLTETTRELPSHHMRPFKSIFIFLNDSLIRDNSLSQWYIEILQFLSHASVMGIEKSGRDFHTLFEEFLTNFDNETRFDLGAFYTPKVLTEYMADGLESLTHLFFNNYISKTAKNIIDPCCGTGGFLESIIKRCLYGKSDSPKLFGFEISPAPYALSYIRLHQLEKQLSQKFDFNIVLTDTLSDKLTVNKKFGQNIFESEVESAVNICSQKLQIVVGNPPSTNRAVNSPNRRAIEALLLEFRPPNIERSDRQNIQKALNNEAYRFLIWSAHQVLKCEAGILALVLPGPFAYSISFKFARKWLMERFGNIYIIEIDSDGRKGQSTHSIFKVMQGRIAIFAIKENINTVNSKIYYVSIANYSHKDKIDFLASTFKINDYTIIECNAPNYIFSPKSEYPEDLWNSFWPLINSCTHKGLFLNKCSGIKLAPSSLLFHTNKETLVRRSKELIDPNNVSSLEARLIKWYKGQMKPPKKEKLQPTVMAEMSTAIQNNNIIPYHFRPFLNGYILSQESLFNALISTPGSGTRARPEIRKAFDKHAVGIALSPSTIDIGNTLTRFCCFSWYLPDNDIASRGNSMIYTNIYPDDTVKDTMVINITEDIIKLFSLTKETSVDLSFYSYAILSSSTYLTLFEGILYGPSDPNNPPRIPIFKNPMTRNKLIVLGCELASLEKVGEKLLKPSNLLVWMVDNKEFKLTSWEYIVAESAFVLKEDSKICVKVLQLNVDVLNLSICGHDVIDKWLRERKFVYLKKYFTEKDTDELLDLYQRILLQLNVIDRIDDILNYNLKLSELEISQEII